jgi:hypothetical protein
MRQGDWYLLNDGTRRVRGRIVENNQRNGYVLFANLSGIKVARLTYAAADEARRSGGLCRVDSRPVFDRVLALALDDWASALDRLQSDREARGLRDAGAARERDSARAQATGRAQARREARERAVSSTAEAIRRMQPGGLLEFIDEDERRVTCRLALVLRSSRKLVFVDGVGRKVVELLPGELAERVVAGSAQVLDYGASFDETLQGLKARPQPPARDS